MIQAKVKFVSLITGDEAEMTLPNNLIDADFEYWGGSIAEDKDFLILEIESNLKGLDLSNYHSLKELNNVLTIAEDLTEEEIQTIVPLMKEDHKSFQQALATILYGE